MSDVKRLPSLSPSATVESTEVTPRRGWRNRRPADRHAAWSSETLGTHRRGDVMEPVSRRAVAMWAASQLSTVR